MGNASLPLFLHPRMPIYPAFMYAGFICFLLTLHPS
uniref:Uncharacterized protein n=1 Tax=Arundo donax TaxID=35708 RepID=A0A0A9G3P2_ARUDO